jgi:hypothetical protein
MRCLDATGLLGWTTRTGSIWSNWSTSRDPKGSREWTSRTMRRGLRPQHTYLCRDGRGGSLPDEVGSSLQVDREAKEDG